jgi:CRP-like cAMP-binding protein
MHYRAIRIICGLEIEYSLNELTKTLIPLGKKHNLGKRTIVLRQGETPQYVYVVLKGIMKTYSLSNTGEEQIIRLLTKNDIFTVPWIFGKTEHSLYYYETQTNCTVLAIERSVFLETIAQQPKLQQLLIQFFATLYTGSMVHITALEQSRAYEKVLTTLYYLCLANGVEFKPNKFKVALNLTHATIASLTGLTRETVALELSDLKKRKVVRYNSRYYLIDKQQVEELLGENNFSNLDITNEEDPL